MATDLTVRLENRAGTLATLGETLANAGINIDGMAGIAGGGEGDVHILVADADAARQALTDAGLECGPGGRSRSCRWSTSPARWAATCAASPTPGVNVDLAYGSSDADGLRRALHA